jgi:hypothetical protein
MTDEPITPPPRRLLFLEPRGLIDIPTLFIAAPFLLSAPRGRKHGVVVLPGFGADDRSTVLLRRYLSLLGYDAHGWNRGRNVRRPGEDLPTVIAQIKALKAKHNAAVTLIGWSRGGIMARESRGRCGRRSDGDYVGQSVRRSDSEQCGRVGSCSPARTCRAVERIKQLAEPIPVPATAIYTNKTASWRGGRVSSARARLPRTSKCARRISGLGFIRRRSG